MYSGSDSDISNIFLRLLKLLLWLFWYGFQALERGEWIEASIPLSTCNAYFSLHRHYFANPNNECVHKWITNHISKFHDNQPVNEYGIVVLLRRFWVSTGKEKAIMQKVFLSAPTCFCNSQRWKYSLMSSKHSSQIS